MLVFSVYDSKAKAYMQPFFFKTQGLAIRAFSSAVQQADHEFSKFAEDYTLFHLGEFDEASGVMTSLPTPAPVNKAVDFKTE